MANQIICGVHTSLFHTTKSLHLRLHLPVKSSELCNNLFSVYIRKIIGIIGHFLIIQGDIAKLKKYIGNIGALEALQRCPDT